MAEINILDATIFNRIAAGEVVENPRSVVKELVENSIDAGATAITVEIQGGGIDLISVADNGKGLSGQDMPLAFLPHATSKICSIEDLNCIATLGFRGEALPSIASVADVSMVSRRQTDEIGYRVQYHNGTLVDSGEIGAALGTSVCVKDLFLNVPARRKFLKKASSEGARVTELIQKLILANPTISFTYLVDGACVYRTDGIGAEGAVYAIYKEESELFLPIFDTMSHITLKGFVSTPLHSRYNRNAQTLIVNNRVVENEEISYSIFLAYKDFLMTRRYPAFVLYIEIPHDLIDVNVHPNKMSIKFVDCTTVKKMIYHAIRRVIVSPSTTDIMTDTPTLAASGHEDTEGLHHFASTQEPCTPASSVAYRSFGPIATVGLLREDSMAESDKPTRADVMAQFEQIEATHVVEHSQDSSQKQSSLQAQAMHRPLGETAMLRGVEEFDRLRIVGKLFSTYILIQSEDTIYCIDQHAAHERILYDRLLAEVDSKNLAVQQLLVSYTFTVSSEESEWLESIASELCAIGFTLTALGDCVFSLSTVPVACARMNLQDFVGQLLANPLKDVKQSRFIQESLAQSACKAAVKGNDDLSESEIHALLDQMRTSGSVPLCPHGRPTFIKLSKLEIDKLFKRVVS